MLDTDNTKVLSWLRQTPDGVKEVIATNVLTEPQTVDLTAGANGVKATHAKTLLKTPGAADPSSVAHIELGPYGVYIGEVK